MLTGLILRVAAAFEVVVGVLVLVLPGGVGGLLLGVDLSGGAVVLARAFGIAIIGLGVACWPGAVRWGMAIYSGGIAVYLAVVGLFIGAGGLLWPVVALHAVIAGLLVWLRPKPAG